MPMPVLAIVPTSLPPRSTTQRRCRVTSAPRRQYRIFAEQEPQEETAETPSEPETAPETVSEVTEPKGPQYMDEMAPLPKRTPLSKEMRNRLRDEYVGLGGAENVSMGANWFLYISIGITVLAVASYLSGAI